MAVSIVDFARDISRHEIVKQRILPLIFAQAASNIAVWTSQP